MVPSDKERKEEKTRHIHTLSETLRGSGLLTADSCEACLQIGNDIIDVLGAYGQADGVLVDLLLSKFIVRGAALGGVKG